MPENTLDDGRSDKERLESLANRDSISDEVRELACAHLRALEAHEEGPEDEGEDVMR